MDPHKSPSLELWAERERLFWAGLTFPNLRLPALHKAERARPQLGWSVAPVAEVTSVVSLF